MHFIEVFVNRLRSKLGRELIATRRGQGYVLVTGGGALTWACFASSRCARITLMLLEVFITQGFVLYGALVHFGNSQTLLHLSYGSESVLSAIDLDGQGPDGHLLKVLARSSVVQGRPVTLLVAEDRRFARQEIRETYVFSLVVFAPLRAHAVLLQAGEAPGVPGGHGASFNPGAALPARGVRLDESRSGHGLGLTIVRDIAELLGGTLAFGRSQELGGLEVRVDLPFPGDASRHGPG
jgi:hypothetical protein